MKKRPSRDIRTGPAVLAAKETAKSVSPGSMVAVAFSAYDTGDLIGLDGRSYVLKLPENAPENNRIYMATQWYLNGKPTGPVDYEGQSYVPKHVEKTRCWLIDLAVLRNWFSEAPHQAARSFFRAKSLDGQGGYLQSTQMLAPPPGYEQNEDHWFGLWPQPDGKLEIGVDTCIGIWFATLDTRRLAADDLIEVARNVPTACLFFIRFQLDRPGTE